MKSIHHHVRRGVAALLCLYVIYINGLAMGNLPEFDASRKGASSPKGIAYYALDLAHSQLIKRLSAVLFRAEDICLDLEAISSDECNGFDFTPGETLRNELMTYFQRIVDDHDVYADLDVMFRECQKISEESKQRRVSPKRLAELKDMMQDLEERFKGMEKMLDAIDVDAVPGFDEDKVQKATEFIAKHKLESTSNASGGAEPAAVVSGVSDTCGKILVDLIDGQFSAPLGSNPKFVASKEMIRRFLDDRSTSRRLVELGGMAVAIYNTLRMRSVEKAYLLAARNKYAPVTKDILSRSQELYENLCDHLVQSWLAAELHGRYHDIEAKMQRRKRSLSVIAALKIEKDEIVTKFEKCAFIIEPEKLEKTEEFYKRLLGAVRNVKSEIRGSIPQIGTLVKKLRPL